MLYHVGKGMMSIGEDIRKYLGIVSGRRCINLSSSLFLSFDETG